MPRPKDRNTIPTTGTESHDVPRFIWTVQSCDQRRICAALVFPFSSFPSEWMFSFSVFTHILLPLRSRRIRSLSKSVSPFVPRWVQRVNFYCLCSVPILMYASMKTNRTMEKRTTSRMMRSESILCHGYTMMKTVHACLLSTGSQKSGSITDHERYLYNHVYVRPLGRPLPHLALTALLFCADGPFSGPRLGLASILIPLALFLSRAHNPGSLIL
ncbi:hypothetical protein F5148DRAFT_742806 [Russula earlei]|uniref:Uncharacterized protein n=1 Tax=Russula earlei TaxID=71964 RepID=A0ACC0UDC9_9AGAM|nr:hypothetical protein F5148DRAFT_742806 [Russula earlei]